MLTPHVSPHPISGTSSPGGLGPPRHGEGPQQHPAEPPLAGPVPPPAAGLTLTMASLVCAMSEMTPSVMMSSTKYWDPSSTVAAELGGTHSEPQRGGRTPKKGCWAPPYRATWLTTGAKLVGP